MFKEAFLLSFMFVTAYAVLNPFRFLIHPPLVSKYDFEVHSFETLVDHFSFVNDYKFSLKYLLSTKFHTQKGPVLFYTGNEGDIETFAENSGFLWEIAENLQAAVVFAEHRYYGSSLPFGNESFKGPGHFGYLVAEQALADFALLIRYLQTSDVNFAHSPFVAFGGSYGGMLAAWFRMKYPNLVAGAVASSAPVWMFPNMSDCHGFYQTATDAFKRSGSEQCVKNVGALWNGINEVIKGPSGNQILSLIFHLCDTLSDAQPLINYLVDFLSSVAMVNYPYEASFLGTYPAHPVQYFCKDLSTFNLDDPALDIVRRVSQAVLSLSNYTKQQKCINVDAGLPGISVSGWNLQTCLEMATPLCADNVNDMFPRSEWNADAFSNTCMKNYGVQSRLDWADVQFWGKKLQTATNIVFSNGGLDPWSAYGVLKQEDAPQCTVINIPSGAHHLDLRAANKADPKDVIAARAQIVKLIQKWTTQ